MPSGDQIGWRRLIIVTTLATAFAIVMDRLGIVNAINRALP